MQMMGGGDVAQSKSGSFTGDGTITTVLDIGFEPDVIVIDSGIDYTTPSAQGLLMVAIAKGKFTLNFYHNSTTDVTSHNYPFDIISGTDSWGADSGAFRNYCIYSDGVLTVTNKTNHANVVFINGQTYNWTAYKA